MTLKQIYEIALIKSQVRASRWTNAGAPACLRSLAITGCLNAPRPFSCQDDTFRASSLEAACKSLIGTARSMGFEVVSDIAAAEAKPPSPAEADNDGDEEA